MTVAEELPVGCSLSQTLANEMRIVKMSVWFGGWIGVDLFFVLSGFLITGILYDAKGGPHYFRNFYMRRSLRIFPLYYAFLILIFAVMPLLRASGADHVGKQVWMWTYLSNVLFARVGWEGMPAHTTHLWSLAIEEQFYLLWPLLVWLASRRRLIQLCVGSIAVAFATRLVLHFVFANDVAAYALIAMGFCLACWWLEVRQRP